VQYDHGKLVSGGHCHLTGILNQPPHILLIAIALLQSRSKTENDADMSRILLETLEKDPDNKARFPSPGPDQDHLFVAAYDHIASESTCAKCDFSRMATRASRFSNEPQVHYGLIASGNCVVKDAVTRDRLAREKILRSSALKWKRPA
jgi:hypothetical protein